MGAAAPAADDQHQQHQQHQRLLTPRGQTARRRPSSASSARPSSASSATSVGGGGGGGGGGVATRRPGALEPVSAPRRRRQSQPSPSAKGAGRRLSHTRRLEALGEATNTAAVDRHVADVLATQPFAQTEEHPAAHAPIVAATSFDPTVAAAIAARAAEDAHAEAVLQPVLAAPVPDGPHFAQRTLTSASQPAVRVPVVHRSHSNPAAAVAGATSVTAAQHASGTLGGATSYCAPSSSKPPIEAFVVSVPNDSSAAQVSSFVPSLPSAALSSSSSSSRLVGRMRSTMPSTAASGVPLDMGLTPRTEVTMLRSALADVQRDRSAEQAAWDAQHSDLRSTVSQLKQELRSTSAAARHAQDDVRQALRDAQQRADDSALSLADANKELGRVRKELAVRKERYTTKLKQKAQKMELARAMFGDLSSSKRKLEAQLNDARLSLDVQRTKMDTLESAVAEAKASVDRKAWQVQSLQEQLRNASVALERQQKQARGDSSQVAALKDALARAKAALDASNRTVQRLTSDLDRQRQQFDARAAEWATKKEQLTAKLAAVQRDKVEADAQLRKLQHQLDELRTSHREELNARQARLEQLAQRASAAEHDCAVHEAQATSLRFDLEAAERARDEARDEMQRMTHRVRRVSKLERELQAKEDAIRSLQQELLAAKAKAGAANNAAAASATAVTAVPVHVPVPVPAPAPTSDDYYSTLLKSLPPEPVHLYGSASKAPRSLADSVKSSATHSSAASAGDGGELAERQRRAHRDMYSLIRPGQFAAVRAGLQDCAADSTFLSEGVKDLQAGVSGIGRVLSRRDLPAPATRASSTPSSPSSRSRPRTAGTEEPSAQVHAQDGEAAAAGAAAGVAAAVVAQHGPPPVVATVEPSQA